MIELSNDILVHHVFPLVAFQDILTLMMVCKSLKAAIDAEWDRRYFSDFHYDARVISGYGMERYIKRYKARLIFNELNSTTKGVFEGEALFKAFADAPIVDFAYTRYYPPDWPEHVREQDPDYADSDAVVVRTFNNVLAVYTHQDIRVNFDTTDISRLRVGLPLGCACLRGWEQDTPMEYDLRDLFIPSYIFGDGYEGELSERIEELQTASFFSKDTSGNSDDETFKVLDEYSNKHPKMRLDRPNASLSYYDKRYVHTNHVWSSYQRREFFDSMVKELSSVTTQRLEKLCVVLYDTFHYSIASASGNTVIVLSRVKEWSKDPIDTLYTYTFPCRIVEIGSYMTARGNTLSVLDEKGTLYGDWFYHSARTTPVVTEPRSLLENVVDLAESTVLMADGSVLCYTSDKDGWSDCGVSDVVMITGSVFLTTGHT